VPYIYKADSWSSDVMTIDLIAAIGLVSPSVTNVIGGGRSRVWYYTSCNLARTHLNDSVSSLDRNQMLNSGRRKRFVLLYVESITSRMFSEQLR
jgi:hypothetical protein